jgi:predicted chitinase
MEAGKTMTMRLNEAQFRAMMPNGGNRLDDHWPYINTALEKFDITEAVRIAAFMAQLAVESGEYRYMEEIADGSAYEGRADLGNIYPGDGRKFKGHGPIQITGRNNHLACGTALNLDLITTPTLLCKPKYGTLSAAWFWHSRDLNVLADAGWFKEITRRINGGYNGLDERLQYWKRNRQVLGLPPVDPAGENSAIRQFQAANHLDADGIVGRDTMAALHREYV